MVVLTKLVAYRDERGNEISYNGELDAGIRINFSGSNNRVIVDDNARLASLRVDFNCDNGLLEIGPSAGVPAFSAAIRIGQDSRVRIGSNVSSTSVVAMSATEGTTIRIDSDVMFASENEVRADDGHPIFDVRSGARVNVSRSIRIGHHVWIARRAIVLGGTRIGDGSVVGYGAVVTRSLPNNCVATGVPARVVRRHIAWERPHLSLTRPFYKPDASTVTKSEYWNLTEDSSPTLRRRLRRRAARTSIGRTIVRSGLWRTVRARSSRAS
jgi:acetyltransferase-like isoleucine patch superfamily enzyme